MNVNVGIDIGSTTVKIVVVRDGEIIHKHYERHFSKVREKAVERREKSLPLFASCCLKTVDLFAVYVYTYNVIL